MIEEAIDRFMRDDATSVFERQAATDLFGRPAPQKLFADMRLKLRLLGELEAVIPAAPALRQIVRPRRLITARPRLGLADCYARTPGSRC